jgi:DNA excision repair protein ERCC-5
MEAFYSFKERFAKIRSKRIEKAIKGITGKSFPDTDEPEQDNPSTSKTTKKKDAGSPSRGSSRGKGTSSEIRDMESPEDTETGDPNSIADMVELTKDSNSTNKSKKGRPSGCSKGRVRRVSQKKKEECEAGRMLGMVQQEVRWILTQNVLLQLQMRICIHMQAITN